MIAILDDTVENEGKREREVNPPCWCVFVSSSKSVETKE